VQLRVRVSRQRKETQLQNISPGNPFVANVWKAKRHRVLVQNLNHFTITEESPQWNGWGAGLSNRRFQPARGAGQSAADIRRLELKWAFGFDGASLAFSQPTIVDGRVFVGSEQGKVFALDADSGCTQWSFQSAAKCGPQSLLGQLRDRRPSS
jgi:outer membrane protein assembly factor BamB